MTKLNVPLLDLVAQYAAIKPEMDAAIQRVLDSGYFILGPEVTAVEEEVADHYEAMERLEEVGIKIRD